MPDRLLPGEGLETGESISADPETSFVMQGDGNAVVYGSGQGPVFNTGTFVPGSDFVMQGDGNAVVYAPGPQAVFSTGTSGNPGAYLVLQRDRNLVVYADGGAPLWSAFTGRINQPPPPSSSDTLSPGGTLTAGQQIASAGNRAVVQGDGNFVAYSAGGQVLFNAGTAGRAGSRLVMQGDGNAVVYSEGSQALYSTGTSGNSGSRLLIQPDSNLVIYTPAGRPVWTRGSGLLATPRYANCDALNRDYPHGVARPGGTDRPSGTVTTFVIDEGLYNENHAQLDRDDDGVACERV